MPEATAFDPGELSRTARFVKFLRNAVAIKTKPVLEVQKYPSVMWFSAMPRDLKEVRSPLITESWPESDSRWLKVARVLEQARPQAPDVCQPWLREVDLESPATPPVLNPDYEESTADGEVSRVPVSLGAQQAWDSYLAADWSEWAPQASVARAVKPVYQRLFSIHQQMQGVSDNYDLFVGVGLFDSRTDPEQRFRRHLLAFPAELSLDDRTGTLSLGPAPDFVSVRLETEFLPTSDRARLQPQIDDLQDDLVALGAALQDQAKIGELITRLITPIHAVTQYVSDLQPADAPPNGAVVSFGAALILRPRSTRSLDALLQRIEKDATSEHPPFPLESLPIPWRKMMEDGRVWETGGEGGGTATRPTGPGRVYFPLPSNEEQSRIVSCANGSPGVVVQGPPGTGKSHTIANLISHYLATGQRVLVTAQSAQALEVLRDKMPGNLQKLCVTLLGNSRASDRDLRRSVDGILTRRQDFSLVRYETRIALLDGQLTVSATRLNNLERTLHQSRAAETETLEPVEGYRGTRAVIARQLRDERPRFAWLRDPIAHGTACPAYRGGWAALATYHGGLNAETRARLARECVVLPFGDDDAVDAVKAIASTAAVIPPMPSVTVKELPAAARADDLLGAANWLRSLEEVEAVASADDAAWCRARRKVLLRNDVDWQTRLEECRSALVPLTTAAVAATVKVDVSSRTAAEARRDLSRLAAHYTAGGSRRTLGVFKPALVKETDWVEQAVIVDGLPVQSPEDVGRARQALEGWAWLDAAWKPWSTWPSPPDGSPRMQAAHLRHRVQILERFLVVAGKEADVAGDLRRWLADHLEAAVSTAELLCSVNRRLAELALGVARAHRDGLVSELRRSIGHRDVVPPLRDLVAALLAEDADAVGTALGELRDEIARRELHKEYVEFIAAVRRAAATLADDIVAAEGDPGFGDAFSVFEAAWRHRCTQDWLETILSTDRIEATHRAAREERQRRQDTLAELTSEMAWAKALGRIDDRRRATLTAWAQAVARIPASGPNVFIRRAQAQRLLSGCLETIPAWVVSLSRLYETVDPVPGLFDVAIVDEASQCWLDSLVLFYLAKQVIIVGDDKQISPTVVGVADIEIDKLAEAFLPDFQFRSSFSLGSSLFDHGRRYLSDGVPLREHFRCVPEIIGFSNALCYQGNPLIPLRQVGKNRLQPLKRTYLSNGIRTGDTNEAEAQAIVEAIAACHINPAYEDADFGVICLQGDMQGARIEQLLLDRLGPDLFTQRRLRCGNPYAFQGDERDVMFLSMVAAPNARQQSLTTTMYEQRFNVAMSRARDQAWLFHSIQEDELGANCLRRRVVEFFRNPPEQTINGMSVDIPHLQLVAFKADRMEERPPRPFDSWFEVDVALALATRGYTLSAQVQVAHKRIDLVIEGNEGVRLAVECDGDAWHGAENYEADRARERQLERAGWRFVRVRECLFYSDETRAIREVIDACEELDISSGDGRARPVAADSPGQPKPPRSTAESADVSNPVADTELQEPADADGFELTGSPLESDREGNDDERGATLAGTVSAEYPDPRMAPAANVRDAVVDVIEKHGPLTKASIYSLYRNGCPRLERVSKSLRVAVNAALSALERKGIVEARDEGTRRLTSEVVYRMPDQPWIARRPGSGRDLEDVPLSELAIGILAAGGDTTKDDGFQLEQILKTVARQYGVLRLRDHARARLAAAAVLAFDTEHASLLGIPQ